MQQSKAWAFAEELRVDFGVDHLMSGPPFLASLNREQATSMNAKINISLDGRKHPPFRFPKRDGAKQIYAPGPHPVQAVRSCSYPECMVLKCTDVIRRHGTSKLIKRLGPDNDALCNLTAQAIEGFVANAPNKTKLRLGLQRNFALVTAMIKAHPCLKWDFQVYMRNDGNVLNIDLDRCWQADPFRDTNKSRVAHQTFTLTTRPLRLTCHA